MLEFLMAILAGIVTAVIIAAVTKWLWPSIQDKCLYKGIRIAGTWAISETRNGKVSILSGEDQLVFRFAPNQPQMRVLNFQGEVWVFYI